MTWYDHEREPQPAVVTPEIGSLPSVDERYWGMFDKYLHLRGLSPNLAGLNSWYPSTDAGDEHPRIVIPATGRLVLGFWQARSMDGAEPRYHSPHRKRGDSIIVVFPGVTSPRHNGYNTVCVCEGPMDALALAEHGFLGIALMGGTPSRQAIDFAASWAGKNRTVFITDRDRPGLIVSVMVKSILRNKVEDALLRVPPEPYKDFAEIPRAERYRVLESWGLRTEPYRSKS